jgi:PadR family transcriptional regulator PadR
MSRRRTASKRDENIKWPNFAGIRASPVTHLITALSRMAHPIIRAVDPGTCCGSTKERQIISPPPSRRRTRQDFTTQLHLRRYLCRLATMGKEDRSVRMSLQTLRVLETFLESPAEQLSGADVYQRCGIASGTLYPILLRLESAGWFVSRWESIDPSTAGRPRRRLYRLTSAGLRRASDVFASFNRGVLV